MDETTLRRLAADLLAELPEKIPDDAERRPVAEALTAALGAPEGEGRGPLLDALDAHPATRQYMREHGADDDVVRGGGLYGNPTDPLGLYYMCPQEDEDVVLLSIPAQPPLCTTHGVPMILQQG
jgi:hypothetical protein